MSGGTVCYLSNNPPGPRMGMGHYEKLLIHHVLEAANPHEWRFEIKFDGRKHGAELPPEDVAPGIDRAEFLGFSSKRLAIIPLFVARGIMRLFEGGTSKQRVYHDLALTIPVPSGRPYITTIHDLPPARFPDEGTLPPWAKRAAQQARAILTPSHFAKQELIELLGVAESRVHVIPNGCVHERFHPNVVAANPRQLAKLGLVGPFLLYTGGYTKRKNVASLLEAWRDVADRYPEISLGLVGPSRGLQEIVDGARTERVTVVGYLTHDQLPPVMKAAEAPVVPSIYEGFGLPALEAMALGVPVVAVRGSAIPEVVGDCAVLAPDGSAGAIATAIVKVLEDPQIANDLRRRGPARARTFSWDEHARSVVRVYEASFR